MNNDHKFFTNEPGSDLLARFKSTLKDTRYFDVLVGFFRTSGYYLLQEPLEKIEKTRILVGMGLDRGACDADKQAKHGQQSIEFDSFAGVKKEYGLLAEEEIENSEDSADVEIGLKRLVEMIKSGKIELRAHPSKSIHAKIFISRYKEGDKEFGSVITGSSNFTHAGLSANHEFNVQLKDRPDVEYALKKFEELWLQSCDVGEVFIDTAGRRTWLNDGITPYELYLKVLYEYFEEDINLQELEFDLPDGFLNLEYQKQAVVSAHKILEAYNGVFLADVVGLGKTYISAMLAQQLEGNKVVICPPVLISYWKQTFHDFGVKKYEVHSLGKISGINRDKADYIFIDEAHRFRNEITQGYEQLQELCFGKKVVLVTATPFNNKFEDIFSQIKLFQPPKNSAIPGVPDLDAFFNDLKKKRDIAAEKSKKSGNKDILRDSIREMAVEVREKVLKYVMVRRTRKEIMKYFSADIIKQGLKFPEVQDPEKMIYEFDAKTSDVFGKTIGLLKEFTYSRYVPYMHLKAKVAQFEMQQQLNIRAFMKEILIKRLESSFHAFKMTLLRFVESYEKFIGMFEKGTVLIGKKTDVYELLENDDEEELLRAIAEKGVKKFKTGDFRGGYLDLLKADYKLLKKISGLWKAIDRDPKLEKFMEALRNKKLKGRKMIIFTESRETGMFLYENMLKTYGDKAMFYSSADGRHAGVKHDVKAAREIIRSNFDPENDNHEDSVAYLISTDVLSEGINLHKANIVINYDLPWNPTKVLQRVGRVNRVGTGHDKIHIYNFFPTDESEKEIGLEETIKRKLQAFHDTLGDDAKYLTGEEEVSSHSLFGDYLYKKLSDRSTYTGESESDESELLYLGIIREISAKNPELFGKIKQLPKKARSGRKTGKAGLVTFFRKGKLKKFFYSGPEGAAELRFMDAAKIFKCESDEKRAPVKEDYYALLSANKSAFDDAVSGDASGPDSRATRSNEYQVIKRLKAMELERIAAFTSADEEYIRSVRDALERGIIPKQTSRSIKRLMEREKEPMKVLHVLKKHIKDYMLENAPDRGHAGVKREIILSEYME